MSYLRTQHTVPSMSATRQPQRSNPTSGLWSRGTRPASTPPEEAVTLQSPDERERETVPAPHSAITRRVPAGSVTDDRSGYDVSIPPSPRVPFLLRPRTAGRWRAEVVAEWVKLSAHDPRCE